MSLLLSNSLLAATMLLGQTTDTPPGVPATPAAKTVITSSVPPPPTIQQTQVQQPMQGPAQPQRGPIMSWFNRDDRPVLSKIQSWFKREQQDTPAQPMKGTIIRETVAPPLVNPTPTPPTNDFPRRMPSPSSRATTMPSNVAQETIASKEVIQTSGQQAVPNKAAAAKTPILPQFVNKMGRDEKFEWITGQLEIENGTYVLYYATPETVDKLHGRITLQPQQVNMKTFFRGDLVSVRGQLVQRATTPVYRLSSANLIERPKQ